MPEGGADEARLTADYNAEMIEQIARFPRVRDRAIFVGAPDDVVPHDFGAGLPAIRPWVEEHFDFSGYALAPDAGAPDDRAALRAELGYAPGERVCVVTVGGSGVGGGLLERVIEAFPEARRRVPGLRMIAVCGPRIDPDSLPAPRRARGARVRARPLAAPRRLRRRGRPGRPRRPCMELAAAKRPFLYFPLRAALRAEPPRPPPARALRRRAARWTTRPRRPRRSPRRSRTRWPSRPAGPGRARRRRAGGQADRGAALAICPGYGAGRERTHGRAVGDAGGRLTSRRPRGRGGCLAAGCAGGHQRRWVGE